MTDEKIIREALAEACAKRGVQAEISKAFNVSQSTVKRWLEGGEIPPPMLKLLDWYFFGTLPPRLASDDQMPSGMLDFSPEEWNIILILSNRVGLTPGQWIAEQIRTIIAFRSDTKPAAKQPDNSPLPFPKPSPPKIMAAAGSPIGAEVMDWNGPSSTILVRICGLSMLPLLDDGDEVAMHSRDVSRSPFMRKGLIYLLHYDGGWMVKRYNTRDPREEELGSDYLTPGGKVPVLESLNPEYPEIPIRGDLNWMAWLDPAEIKK